MNTLFQPYMNKQVLVMITNEALNPPRVGDVSDVRIHEIEGKLVGYDDVLSAIEVQTEDGTTYVLNWTWCVGIQVQSELDDNGEAC